MEPAQIFSHIGGTQIKTIEMHTCGEPTRIIYSGFPTLNSKYLLEQRAEAQSQHDRIRRALICEPRGHREMYGAIIRPRTELVDSGQADVGTLFLTNEGYSVMCGHATLALSRLLVDNTGGTMPEVVPELVRLKQRIASTILAARTEVELHLHVPCGLVKVTVPIIRPEKGTARWKCDTSRPISYLSVPSFAAAIDVKVPIPPHLRWPELGDDRQDVTVDVAYGGTFYIITPPSSLGFSNDALAKPNIAALSLATKNLKAAFNASEKTRKTRLYHPDSPDLQFLYATILVDRTLGHPAKATQGAETGICFFADQQIDRSPTGSGVQARVALAFAKGERKLDDLWTYHSLVSNAHDGEGAFIGRVAEEVDVGDKKGVVVWISGHARYTGACSFVIEDDDEIGKGFWFPGSRG